MSQSKKEKPVVPPSQSSEGPAQHHQTDNAGEIWAEAQRLVFKILEKFTKERPGSAGSDGVQMQNEKLQVFFETLHECILKKSDTSHYYEDLSFQEFGKNEIFYFGLVISIELSDDDFQDFIQALRIITRSRNLEQAYSLLPIFDKLVLGEILQVSMAFRIPRMLSENPQDLIKIFEELLSNDKQQIESTLAKPIWYFGSVEDYLYSQKKLFDYIFDLESMIFSNKVSDTSTDDFHGYPLGDIAEFFKQFVAHLVKINKKIIGHHIAAMPDAIEFDSLKNYPDDYLSLVLSMDIFSFPFEELERESTTFGIELQQFFYIIEMRALYWIRKSVEEDTQLSSDFIKEVSTCLPSTEEIFDSIDKLKQQLLELHLWFKEHADNDQEISRAAFLMPAYEYLVVMHMLRSSLRTLFVRLHNTEWLQGDFANLAVPFDKILSVVTDLCHVPGLTLTITELLNDASILYTGRELQKIQRVIHISSSALLANGWNFSRVALKHRSLDPSPNDALDEVIANYNESLLLLLETLFPRTAISEYIATYIENLRETRQQNEQTIQKIENGLKSLSLGKPDRCVVGLNPPFLLGLLKVSSFKSLRAQEILGDSSKNSLQYTFRLVGIGIDVTFSVSAARYHQNGGYYPEWYVVESAVLPSDYLKDLGGKTGRHFFDILRLYTDDVSASDFDQVVSDMISEFESKRVQFEQFARSIIDKQNN